jgi:PurA ssDNA and RNA-binding protein
VSEGVVVRLRRSALTPCDEAPFIVPYCMRGQIPPFRPAKNDPQLPYPMSPNPESRVYAQPIASEKVIFERKRFFLDLNEDERGRYLEFTVDNRGRRSSILVPAQAFAEFADALQRLVAFNSIL